MEENKYLNEEKYQENAKKVKKIGKMVLVIGVLIIILGVIFLFLGFTGFGKTGVEAVSGNGLDQAQTAKGIMGRFGLFALGGILNAVGFFVTGVGIVLTVVSHRREIMSFTTQQVMPIAKEGIDKMAPTIGNAASEIAKGITKGINEANKEE